MIDHRILDHDASVRDFNAKLQSYTREAVCGRPYVLVAKLTQWLRSKVDSPAGTTQVTRLLFAAYRESHSPGLPITPETCSVKDSSCLLVFSILLVIGRGNLIDTFHRHDIVDTHLPIPQYTLRERLHKVCHVDQLAESFNEVQWRFCPAKFELHVGYTYPIHKIIPICRKCEINDKGRNAKLWQIEIQEEFIGPQLKEAVSNSKYNVGPSLNEPDWVCCIIFPLKLFTLSILLIYLLLASVINLLLRPSKRATKQFMRTRREPLTDFEITVGWSSVC